MYLHSAYSHQEEFVVHWTVLCSIAGYVHWIQILTMLAELLFCWVQRQAPQYYQLHMKNNVSREM